MREIKKVSDLREGNVIVLDDKLFELLDKTHVKPGKGGAFFQLKLRDFFNGNQNNYRISTEESLEVCFIKKYKGLVIKKQKQNKSYLYTFLINENNFSTSVDFESMEDLNQGSEVNLSCIEEAEIGLIILKID